MIKPVFLSLSCLLLTYLLLWPVPVQPVAWQAPTNQGFVGDFQSNQRLSDLKKIPLKGAYGPEDFALSSDGVLYSATENGDIWRMNLNDEFLTALPWVNTGGRPLGIEFASDGNLIVADAFKGLLSVSPSGVVSTLANQFNGEPMVFVDDVDVMADGRIVFSDASSKFGAEAFGGTLVASKFDVNEHGAHGRVLIYDPRTFEVQLLASGLQFANGIAISADQRWALVTETGSYRVIKIGLAEDNWQEQVVLIANLPGLPDNIARSSDGHFWVGLVSTRVAILDVLSDFPALRKVAQRFPTFMQPGPTRYGHVFKMTSDGDVLSSLQDPAGDYIMTTGAVEYDGHLYVSSLHEPGIGYLPLDPKIRNQP